MKSKLILGLLSLFMVFSMTSCMEKVDAGCEGIKVNLYGSDKGVDDASLVTGIVWYNPWTTTGTLYNYVKDAFRIQLNKFTTDDIVSKRDSIENAIERYLTQALAKENFQLEQLTSGLKYPQTIVESVNAKNKAIQQAMQVENEVKVAEAQAKKLIVAAEAEKKANELRQQALTPAILEKMWIEKWDGKLPVYGQVPTIFKDISK